MHRVKVGVLVKSFRVWIMPVCRVYAAACIVANHSTHMGAGSTSSGNDWKPRLPLIFLPDSFGSIHFPRSEAQSVSSNALGWCRFNRRPIEVSPGVIKSAAQTTHTSCITMRFMKKRDKRMSSGTIQPNKKHRSGRPWSRVRARVLTGQPQYCYLCHGEKGPIRYDVKFPHPLSATVDHVIPAKNFDHLPEMQRRDALWDLSNLKPAHKVCNDSKQDDAAPQHALKCNPGKIAWYSK